ncbi:glycosyltransferase family 2 protein [Brevibacterium spongiae]|uniref:Glycosyltransferase family 2 protein n=1 Tax=Brevibacterium spongiae TaxID=2909672 RepID=A0ABY5SMT7_9MICO|nr:glycosyltransferase family A protein [Brevibacterium spongiae]UVI35782.1 glycosyltransferase family 2 protein [Brevibacterium spongiae]
MSNELISVIVPVYNGQRYLADCLRSVLRQCHEELELIVVDDGSTDSTPAIIEGFAMADDRVVRLLADHGGASRARNAALDIARGEWVMFVDADDEMLSPCLLTAVAGVDCSGVDVVTFETTGDPLDLAEARDRALVPRHMCASERVRSSRPRRVLDPDYLVPRIADESLNTVWNKAYRRRTLMRSGARFPVGISLGEDLLFNLAVARGAVSAVHLPLLGYYYRRDNSASVTRQFHPGKHEELMGVNDALQEFASELGSARLRAAAGYIRAKNAVSSTRDLHHLECPFTLRKKLSTARGYRDSAPHVSVGGLGTVQQTFGTAYNLVGHRSLFALTWLLAAQGLRRRAAVRSA